MVVYPGGDHETHRPSWESAQVDFRGRKGFIRLALNNDVPIVPLPSKITIDVLPPINLREEFGRSPDIDTMYDEVIARMQASLTQLQSER